MLGLRTWWVGAVGTTALRLQPDALTLAVGAVAGFVTALGVILLMLRQAGRAPVPALLKGALEAGDAPARPGRRAPRPPRARVAAAWGRAALFTLIAAGLLLASAVGAMPEAGAFFGAGACAMAAGLFALSGWLRRPSSTPGAGPGLAAAARSRRHRRPRASRPQRAGVRADRLRDLRRRRGRRVPARRCRLAGRSRVRHRRLHPDGGVGGAADVRSGHRRGPLAVRARLARSGADARGGDLRSVPRAPGRRRQLPQSVSPRQPAHRGAVAGVRGARRPLHVRRDDCRCDRRRARQPVAPARSPLRRRRGRGDRRRDVAAVRLPRGARRRPRGARHRRRAGAAARRRDAVAQRVPVGDPDRRRGLRPALSAARGPPRCG